MFKQDVYDYIYKRAAARGEPVPKSKRQLNNAVGEFVGVGGQAVEYWKEIIPEGRAYQIYYLTSGAVKVHPEHYQKGE